MEFIILSIILPYLINLASNERTAAMHDDFEQRLTEALNKREKLKEVLSSGHTLKDEIHTICNQLAKERDLASSTVKNRNIWRLMNDDVFQTEIASWLMI